MKSASLLKSNDLNNTERSLSRRSTRLKHAATSQGNGGSDSDFTTDPKQLVIWNEKSETRESYTYLEVKKSIPTVKINRYSAQLLRSSVIQGEQDILHNLCNDDDVKEYSIF